MQSMDLKTLLLSFEGRASRSDYWLRFALPYFGIGIVAAIIDYALNTNGVIQAIISILAIWPSLAVMAKRCHDRDRSAWFMLIGIVPLLNIWLLVEVWCLRGTIGPNRFGADPVGLMDARTASI